MNHNREVSSTIKIVEEMDIKHPYSVVRSLLHCNVIKSFFDEKNKTKQKEIIVILENYFDFIDSEKKVDALKTLIDNYELQNIIISTISFDNIKQWIKESIIERKKYVSKSKCSYENNYSQNLLENQLEFLDIIKIIIVKNNFLYGDVIYRLMDELDLDLLFFSDNNRYRNQLIFSKYSLFNLMIYFDCYISKVDFTFQRNNEFLLQFMINILFDQKNNFQRLYNVVQNKEIDKKEILINAEHLLVRRFKQGFLKTKTQYYVKFGMNTNSKIRTFERTQNKDILMQIHRISEKWSDSSILDLYYLSFIREKDLSSIDISKIDRIVEDLIMSNPKAIAISNDVNVSENKLIQEYVEKLKNTIVHIEGMVATNFVILKDIENEYMIKLFEGIISINSKEYEIKIAKLKGMLFTYVTYKKENIFKDRIFTKEDATRIVEFIKYEDKWGR